MLVVPAAGVPYTAKPTKGLIQKDDAVISSDLAISQCR